LNRRHFLYLPVALSSRLFGAGSVDIAKIDRARILKAAQAYLNQKPVTVTAFKSPRSAGGPHDYSSDADYWWPDPNNPDGPYIQRDGMTNPGNFIAHRHALMQLSLYVPALAAAWLVTKQRRYADHAARHLRAWFLDPETLMNPNLLYTQAIKGRLTGRGTGIIDTLHLVEVARAVSVLESTKGLTAQDSDGVRKWFQAYLTWMTTHPYGIAERDAVNNHTTCWVEQAAEFARVTGAQDVTRFCRDRCKSVILPTQMGPDGSFPLELKRTKPYGYSLFNLDAMAMVCQILSTPEDNLWKYELPDGRGMNKAMEFMVPFIADKKQWRLPPDVMYFDQWPVRHPSLLFAGLALDQPGYIQLWRKLDPDPKVEETIRNYPVRQPVLWLR
jgi:hypothetical protein